MIRKRNPGKGFRMCIFLVTVFFLVGEVKKEKNRKLFKLRKIVIQIR